MSDADFDGRAESLGGMLLDAGAVSADVADIVVQRHEAFWATQKTLVEALSIDAIDRDQYLDLFNDEVSTMMRSDRRIMGDDAYATVFGADADQPVELIDRDVFLGGEPDDDLDVEPGLMTR